MVVGFPAQIMGKNLHGLSGCVNWAFARAGASRGAAVITIVAAAGRWPA
jgi:hypothetical protein